MFQQLKTAVNAKLPDARLYAFEGAGTSYMVVTNFLIYVLQKEDDGSYYLINTNSRVSGWHPTIDSLVEAINQPSRNGAIKPRLPGGSIPALMMTMLKATFTYSTITSKSAEQGGFEDHGFVFDGVEYPLNEHNSKDDFTQEYSLRDFVHEC